MNAADARGSQSGGRSPSGGEQQLEIDEANGIRARIRDNSCSGSVVNRHAGGTRARGHVGNYLYGRIGRQRPQIEYGRGIGAVIGDNRKAQLLADGNALRRSSY